MASPRVRGIVVAACVAVCGLTGAAPVLADGTTAAEAGGTTVSVEIPNVVLEGPECMQAPVIATFEEVESFATIHLAAAPEGSQDALSTSLMATASGEFIDSFEICPRVDPLGDYNVNGTLNTAVQGAQFTPTTFRVSKARTRFTALTSIVVRDTLVVRGRVVAMTNNGDKPAAGSIQLFGFLSRARGGTGSWTAIGKVYPDKNGMFSISGQTRRRLEGMYVRARLVPDFWALPSMRTVQIPPQGRRGARQ